MKKKIIAAFVLGFFTIHMNAGDLLSFNQDGFQEKKEGEDFLFDFEDFDQVIAMLRQSTREFSERTNKGRPQRASASKANKLWINQNSSMSDDDDQVTNSDFDLSNELEDELSEDSFSSKGSGSKKTYSKISKYSPEEQKRIRKQNRDGQKRLRERRKKEDIALKKRLSVLDDTNIKLKIEKASLEAEVRTLKKFGKLGLLNYPSDKP